MSRRFDVGILGGGIVGASAAFEAARRGASVFLVDRGDLAGGASSNSMRIAHGGLRYLQHLDLRRCRESVRERRRLLRLAPRTIRPLPCRLELGGRSPLYRAAFAAGLLANELLSADRNLGVPRGARLPVARYPRWFDALIEDTEGLLLSLLHTAGSLAPLEIRLHTVADPEPLPAGGHLLRLPDGGAVEVRTLLRCTGGDEGDAPAVVSMNLVVDRLGLGRDGTGVGFRHPDDGRNVFCVPWRGCTIVGTYDRTDPGPSDRPLQLREAWVDEMLRWLAPVHPELAALDRRRIRLVHAGRLPPARPGERTPTDRAVIARLSDGSTRVVSPKWTTALGVASRAVGGLLGPAPRSEGPGLVDRGRLREEFRRERGPERPARPAAGAPDPTAVRFHVEREWATHLEDLLLRRSGLAATGHPGVRRAEAVARLMGEALGWDEARLREELEAFHGHPRFAGNVPLHP